MSFILDALKKSEAERARQAGPTLVDMRVVAPRQGLPAWVIVLGVVLLANLVVLAIVLARGGRTDGTASAVAAPAAAPVAVPAATPIPPAEPQPTNALPPPTLPPATVLPAVEYASRPAALPTAQPGPEAADLSGGRLITPVTGTQPAPVPQPARTLAPRANPAALPSAEDLRLSGIALPVLSMALHAWDPQPALRYVILNGQKLREGQQTADGVVVEQIDNDGAVLAWHEQRFVLTPGD